VSQDFVVGEHGGLGLDDLEGISMLSQTGNVMTVFDGS